MLVVKIVFLSESVLLHADGIHDQQILVSWFMLKPFVEISDKSNYSLTKKKKKKSLQLSMEDYNSKNGLIGLPLTLNFLLL